MADSFDRRYFILAPNYHGATLLSKLLNAHPDVVSLGDTYPSNRFDQTCGCGANVSTCSFWQAIKKKVRAERYMNQPAMLPVYPGITNSGLDRYLYNALSPMRLRRLIPRKAQEEFVADYNNFVNAVYELQDQGSSTVFVDGVKSISRVKAFIASGMNVDGVIHLTRGSGDFVKSSMKQSGETLRVLGKNALSWRLYHNRARSSEQYVRGISITYELLAENTDDVLGDLFGFLGVSRSNVESLRPNMDGTWHYMGNASLFKFDGRIRRSKHELTKTESLFIKWIAGRQ